MYESSKVMKAIVKMSLKHYNDTRVEFVVEFFDSISIFNEFADESEHMGYVTIRSLLATAVASDKEMTGCFTTCQPTGDKHVKITALKEHMLSEAAMFDSRSDLEQSGINSRKDLKASEHRQVNENLQAALETLDDPELVSPNPAMVRKMTR